MRSGFEFSFIGLSKNFQNKIDWNFNGFGKLWNYNLQYLNYINDEKIDIEKKFNIVNDIHLHIKHKHLNLESYPVSIRIINLFLFYQKFNFNNQNVKTQLLYQINFLENNLEYHLLGNHLLENIFSLFVSGHFIKNKNLIKKANLLLRKELNEQILKDGAHYECSPMYHSLMLSKLILCIELARQSNFITIPDIKFLELKASIMFSWLQSYSFEDGSWALFNDSALGISVDTLTLKNCINKLKIPFKKNIIFNDSGFRKLTGKNFELIIKAGNVQPSYQPGHVHSDMMSYCLFYKGQQLIVDPGVSTYNISKRRSFERSTMNHNTVSINSHNQSNLWSSFRVGKRAKCKIISETKKSLVMFVTNFYKDKSWEHKRSIVTSDKHIVIEDEVFNLKKCDTAFNNIHFDCDTEILLKNKKLYSDKFQIKFNDCKNIRCENYYQSKFFGQKLISKKIKFINQKKSVIKILLK